MEDYVPHAQRASPEARDRPTGPEWFVRDGGTVKGFEMVAAGVVKTD
jgi:hypothetical protein